MPSLLRCAFVALLVASLAACGAEPDPPDRAPGIRTCGNGHVEFGEACDDGNVFTEPCPYGAASCTVCDAGCALVPGAVSACGDGVLDPVHEGCDDGNAITESCAYGQRCSVCDASCTVRMLEPRVCGDGVIDHDAGEVCDEGEANDDAAPEGGCTRSCARPECGDGLLAGDEECEPAGQGTCREDCTVARCGDGRLDPGEACDEGPGNGTGPDRCRVDCVPPTCGDGVVDSGEACDLGIWPLAGASALGDRGCIRRDDGALSCWGSAALEAIPAELAADPAVDVSVGDGFACAVRVSGGITCWGDEPFLQPLAPSPLVPPAGRFLAVSAGAQHACALDDRSQLRCWGRLTGTLRPAGRFAQVVSGDGFSCVRRDGGASTCWGADTFGELELPVGTHTQLAASSTHVCAIRAADGLPVCWGDDREGQVRRAPAEPLRDLSVGAGWSCGLRDDGNAVCWGDPAAIAPQGALARLLPGTRCGVDAAGTIRCGAGAQIPVPANADGGAAPCRLSCAEPRCGDGVLDPGEACDGGDGCSAACERIGSCGDGVVQAAFEACDEPTRACDYGTSCAVCNELCQIGPGAESACGDGVLDPPELCDDGGGWSQIDLGTGGACGITQAGRLRCERIPPPAGNFALVRVGGNTACALGSAGGVNCSGGSLPTPQGTFLALDLGANYGCGVRADGTLHCWSAAHLPWLEPPAAGGWTDVSAGPSTACALRDDGTVRCWGDGLAEADRTPAGAFVAVAAGREHLCGILVSGALRCWGPAFGGESTLRPPVGSYTAVVSGGRTTCALDPRGEARCFGTAGLVASSGRFVALAASEAEVCGLRPDGRSVCFADGQPFPRGNDDARPDACRTDCTPARCGDGVVDSGEWCDDGNTADGDGCSAVCVFE